MLRAGEVAVAMHARGARLFAGPADTWVAIEHTGAAPVRFNAAAEGWAARRPYAGDVSALAPANLLNCLGCGWIESGQVVQ